MHTIRSAVLKPGVTLDAVPGSAAAAPLTAAHLVRGRALIFWDPEAARHQIRPQARRHRHRPDHAGRRLRLGEPRHAGRALEGWLVPLPDARFPRSACIAARPSSIAGDRFAIGSSREMSPAGPEGHRRRSRPRDGHRLRRATWATSSAATRSTSACTSCRAPRRLPTRETATSSASIRPRAGSTNVTQGTRPTQPLPLTPKEDEIRRSGGIVAVGRRELPHVDRARRRRIEFAEPALARAR